MNQSLIKPRHKKYIIFVLLLVLPIKINIQISLILIFNLLTDDQVTTKLKPLGIIH